MNQKGKQSKLGNTDPKQSSIAGKVAITFDMTPLNNIVNAISEKKKAQIQVDEAENGFSERQAIAQEGANAISKRLFNINVGMFVATIMVFGLNYCGLKAAESAAIAANNSATTADKTFQEVKNEFEFDNKPFLEVSSIDMSFDDKKKTTHFSAIITNVGKQTGKFISGSIRSGIELGPNSFDNFKNNIDVLKENALDINYYIVSGHPAPFSWDGAWDDSAYLGIKSGKFYVPIYSKMIYKSLATGKTSYYEFLWQLRNDPKTNTIKRYFTYNENRDTVIHEK